MLRIVGIWIFGLVGFGLVGGMIGQFLTPYSEVGGVAGACVFACLRLWFGDPSDQNSN